MKWIIDNNEEKSGGTDNQKLDYQLGWAILAECMQVQVDIHNSNFHFMYIFEFSQTTIGYNYILEYVGTVMFV